MLTKNEKDDKKWPPDFLESIKGQMRSKPLKPVLDMNWVSEWQKARDLCVSQIQTVTGEQQRLWQNRIDELLFLQGEIFTHNFGIMSRYTDVIKELRVELFYEEISQRLENRYVFIGYKGVSLARAKKIYEDDLNSSKGFDSPSGHSRGEGFYVTPHFETALDFAKYAALLEAAEGDASLLAPIYPSDDPTVSKVWIYQRKQKDFERKKSSFEQSDGWKRFAIVIRVYCEDFFALHGVVFNDSAAPLHDDCLSYDYLEGKMDGGVSKQWEIKFNKKEEVYRRIFVASEPRFDIGPDLPQGVGAMLEMVERLDAQPHDSLAPTAAPGNFS